MLTEDGNDIFYEKPFWIVVIQNFGCDIGTPQELELYHPYETIIHSGCPKINVFGRKLFSTEEAAIEWIKNNKPK